MVCINDLGIYILTLEFGTFRGDELLCLVVPGDGQKRMSQTFFFDKRTK